MPQLTPVPFNGLLYRATNIEFIHGVAHPDFLYSYGTGQRYTPMQDAMRTIYMAVDAQTAHAEAARYNDSLALGILPIVAVASIKAKFQAVLDITDSDIQDRLGTNVKELTAPYIRAQARGDIVPTQELSIAVFTTGLFQAIRYPSAQPSGTSCLVAYYERIIHPAYLELIDPSGRFEYRIPLPAPY